MKILITGGTGLVGQALIKKLMSSGYEHIHVLTRNTTKNQIELPVTYHQWNPNNQLLPDEAIKDVDIIYHLAGDNVADGRWSENKKKAIEESRVNGTQTLLLSLKKNNVTPKKFISASAIGIYGNCGEKEINENAPQASDFLAQVCSKWENTLLTNQIPNMKVHILRTGIVLSTDGGALKKMLPPFLLGGGGRLGDGKQYMSWIHIDDLVKMYISLMEKEYESKIFNGVSPNPVTNNEFTKILGTVLKRPTIFPVPSFALKILFGEMSQILLEGQKVIPQAFIDKNYTWDYPTLDVALADLLKYKKKGEIILERYTYLSRPKDKVFEFFSNEKNLEKLTPQNLHFKVKEKSTNQIQEGTVIKYNLKLNGIPLSWTSKINNFEKEKRFVDEQISGPYTKWVHLHEFIQSKDNNTIMRDFVVYRPPFGPIGRTILNIFIARNLKTIFDYRTKVINEIYN